MNSVLHRAERATLVASPRRSRRRATLGAALAVSSALLVAACGGGSSSGGGSAGSSGGSSSGGGGGSSKGSITVWHYFSDPNQVKVMTDFAAKFQAAHPGTKVNNVFVPYDQMNSKLIAAARARSGPDVIAFNGAETGILALAGVLAPLDKQWASFADAKQFPASVIHKNDGKVYSVQGYVNLLGLWYNADLLKKLKVQPPATLSDLEKDMAAAKQAGDKGITLCALPQGQGEWQAYPWMTSQGFTYSSPDKGALTKAFSMVRDWVKKGYLSQEAVTWDQTVPFQQFTRGDVAFAENGNWQIGTAKSDAKFAYGVVPLPVGPTGKVYLGGEGEGIGAFSKNPDLAWQYLQETYLDAKGQLITTKDVGSIPSRLDAAKDPTVTGNPLLKPFAEEIAKYGANYPAENIPSGSIGDIQLAVGQAWSAAVGGQQSPDQAASSAVNGLKSKLGS